VKIKFFVSFWQVMNSAAWRTWCYFPSATLVSFFFASIIFQNV